MSPTNSPSSAGAPELQEKTRHAKGYRGRLQALLLVLLIIPVVVVWQVLNNRINNTDPAVMGRPLSNAQTHLHTVAFGGSPNVLYLGTHYGLFISHDGGRTWPQQRGMLNNLMIMNIAVSPGNPRVLAVIGRPTSGLGNAGGIYLSSDEGNTWQMSGTPAALSPSAYLFTIQAGSGSAGHFYAFYQFAGWYETRDMGVHWQAITSGTLSAMQTPSLLTDPSDPNHLWLGGDQGLFETHDDGHTWNQVRDVNGKVLNLVASTTLPRLIYCTTDQGIYRWQQGSTQITAITNLPIAGPPGRLATDASGKIVYALSGPDLWYSSNGGLNWQHRWQFDRGDLISLLVDPLKSQKLYAGFFMPAKVMVSTDGGNSWQTLTA
ncbi:MAG: WD40/YVTN/BNR-like repeat-containing protein [Ktedonobacteraceae bacterium]